MRISRRELALVGLLLATGGCAASSGHVPRPFPSPGASPPAVLTAERTALIGTALALRGVPYRLGGADPSGFDCSGFVHYVFGRHGLQLPRVVTDQYRAGRPVGRSEIAPGDLIFFTTIARGASHVGIALGDGEFVHAPSSRGEVRVERISSSYWARRFVGARRLLP